MGLVQRDGINRRRHVMKHSRWYSSICVALSDAGWIVGVGSKRTATAEKADLHVAPRSGPDGALTCAMMHMLFAEGFADWDYLRAYTD